MVRKLIPIIIVFITMILMPLSSYAAGRHGGGHRGFRSHTRSGGHAFRGHARYGHRGIHNRHGHHGHFRHHRHRHYGHFYSSFFFGLGAVFPFVIYPYYTYPYYAYPYATSPPAAQSYGILVIQVTPNNVEIYVDGSFIGTANNFREPARVLVPSGSHVVEFRYNSSISTTTTYVASGSESVVSGQFSPIPRSSKKSSMPLSYKYSPTVYLQDSTGLLKLDAEPAGARIYIDGKPLGTAMELKNGVIALSTGSHNIRVIAAGYSTYQGKVNIPENGKIELSIYLEKRPGFN